VDEYHSQYIRTEILRHVGVESQAEAGRLFEQGWPAGRFYKGIRDFPRLGSALQALANCYQLGQDEPTAKVLT
jgi:hypothetical protein